MNLSRFPRVSLGHFPTPLEPMPRLREALVERFGEALVPKLWIKRDDCAGLSSGGNKTRKLEWLMADALEKGANTVFTHGATQSNHARQTAAAAARLGLACELLLEDRTGIAAHDYKASGNVLLDKLHGAVIHHCAPSSTMDADLAALADRASSRPGMKAYVIPGGGSNPTGALGYVSCAQELLQQAQAMGLVFDELVHATGSAGTQAGLVVGLAGSKLPVLGIGVRVAQAAQEEKVFALADRTASHLGAPGAVKRAEVQANCDYVGSGYGLPTEGMKEALRLLAQKEGLLLDPVYSGKGMHGLIDLIGKGRYSAAQTVVFLHTGGSVGLFGYEHALN
jgi:L-cysteate sulfo-lyase